MSSFNYGIFATISFNSLEFEGFRNNRSKLLEKDRTVITRHINNILKDKEVDEKSNVQKMHFTNSDKPVKLYGLDIVLAVGYRTNSAVAIKFRQWATRVLKEYILKGYVINKKRLDEFEKEISKFQYFSFIGIINCKI